eukprot:1148392-Pelagomonas_calceolata.AAC.14
MQFANGTSNQWVGSDMDQMMSPRMREVCLHLNKLADATRLSCMPMEEDSTMMMMMMMMIKNCYDEIILHALMEEDGMMMMMIKSTMRPFCMP